MIRASLVPFAVATATALVLCVVPAQASEHDNSFENPGWHTFGLGLSIVDELSLRTALGVEFQPPDDFIQRLTAGGGPDVDVWIEGLTFIQAYHRGADPRTRTSSDWTGAEIDATIAPGTQAAAIEAEVALAELLANPLWAEPDSDSARLGHLLIMEAKALADYAIVNLRLDNGLYATVSSGEDGRQTAAESPLGEHYAMLQALSRLSRVLADGGRYADPAFRPWFVDAARDLATRLREEQPSSAREAIDRLTAASAFLSVFPDDEDARIDAETAVTELATFEPDTWSDRAAMLVSIRRAEEAGLDTGDVADPDALQLAVLEGLPADGSDEPIQLAQLADVMTALSLVAASGNDSSFADDAHLALNELISVFFDQGGMMPPPQLSQPARSLLPIALQATMPERDATTLMLPLGSARFDPTARAWVGDPGHVDVAGAFRASQALISISADLDPECCRSADLDPGAGSSAEVAVTSTEFAFQPGRVRVEAGSEFVLTLDNQGVVPHNIEITELGIFVESLAGSVSSIAAVAPDVPGSYQFICSIPGHLESGMVGELVVVAAPPEAQGITGPSIRMPAVDNLKPAVVMAAGFALAMTAFVVGLIRFIRTAEDD